MEGPLRDTQIKNPFVGLIIVYNCKMHQTKSFERKVSDVVQPNARLNWRLGKIAFFCEFCHFKQCLLSSNQKYKP